MDGFSIPNTGLKLAHIPRAADPYKTDKVPQAVVLDLSGDGVAGLLRVCQHAVEADMTARLGAKPVIEFSNNSAEGSAGKLEISSRLLEKSLALSDNGFIYKTNSGAELSTLRARLDLRMPKKGNHDEMDAGLLALTRGINDTKAQKESHRTTLADPNASKKRKASRTSLLASITGSNDPRAHRVGLFGGSKKLSSLNNSPSLAPLSPLGRSGKSLKKAAVEEAKKRALVHLLAIKPISKSQIEKAMKCPVSEIEHLLMKHGQTSRADSSKYELRDPSYKLIDPWSFQYTDSERTLAIDHAIEAFDRKRLGKTDVEWQILLAPHKRGKGDCPSKLLRKLLVDPPAHAPNKNHDVRSTPIPDINVSEAGTPPPDAVDGQSGAGIEGSNGRKRSSSDSVDGDAGERVAKKSKQTVDSREKRLFASSAQREKERAKERAKEAKRRETASSKQSPARPSPKKAVDVKGSAPPSSKIKSTEFVSVSDDEDADAVVEQARAARATKNEASAAPKPSPKPTQKNPSSTKSTAPVSSAASARKPSSEKTAERSTASTTVKKTMKPAESEKSAKPSAWDFTKNKAPATSNLNRPSAKTSTASRSASSTNVNLHHRRQLSSSRLTSGSKGGMMSPSQRAAAAAAAASGSTSTTVAAKPAVKPPEKPASQRDLVRKLDSAKRSSTGEHRVAKPANLKLSSNKDKDGSATNPPSSAGRSSGAGMSGKSSDSAKAPPMQKTFSHQRKSSSPLKPSPLAASPPINLSDIDDTARNNTGNISSNSRPPKSATQLPKKPMAASAEARGVVKTVKRKADEIDGKQSRGAVATTSSSSSSGPERPVKRRETGTAASLSSGANQPSKSARDTSNLGVRRYSQEEGGGGGGGGGNGNNAGGNKSHSPSPASSTIGSSTTSTKGTSMSLLGAGPSKERNYSEGKSGNVTNDNSGGVSGGNVGNGAKSSSGNKALGLANKSTVGKDGGMIKGITHSELERLSRFEEHREEYNRKQREVAAMENPPIEKVRELNKLFHSLETQKKVLAAL